MSANVESMFYVREKPWHGLGVRVEEAPTSADALRLAGLDWTVEKRNIQLCGGAKIANYKANVRSTDGAVLGIVTDQYQVVQNTEAFSFTDSLLEHDVRYETAGSLHGGRKIWLLAKMPERQIVGDAVEPYLCFSNAHDGSGAIRVCMTPVRVVCNNTLNLAMSTARRSWSVKHMGDIASKLDEARQSLALANKYMNEMAIQAEKMAEKKISDAELEAILDEMFPASESDSERKKNTAQKAKDEFMVCYMRPDIAVFMNTAWGVVNAMSDMVSHSTPLRQTANYRENNWGRIMDGHKLLDRAAKLAMV